MNRKSKNVIHRNVKNWNDMIAKELEKDSDIIEKALADPKARVGKK
jgi:hypothetical protein